MGTGYGSRDLGQALEPTAFMFEPVLKHEHVIGLALPSAYETRARLEA